MGGVLLAGWVAVVGLLFPRSVQLAVPWQLPPLHAQVIGAFYLAGAVFMAAMAASTTWSRQAVVVPMIAVWTGGLLVVLLVHWDRVQRIDATVVVVWLIAYTVLPVTEAWRLWTHRRIPAPTPGPGRSPWWLRGFLAGTGVTAAAVAVLLVVRPPAWPWPADPFVLHVYAPPLAAFGLGFLLSARRPLRDLAIVLPASALFAGTVLVVSVLRLDVFRQGTATVVWFTGFAVVFAGLTAGTAAGWIAGRRPGRVPS